MADSHFTPEQLTELGEIYAKQFSLRGLNWKIVQTIPDELEKDTLYFHQVGIVPRTFDLLHTDKDKDIATLNKKYDFSSIPEYSNSSEAITGGLVLGDLYRTGENLKIVIES